MSFFSFGSRSPEQLEHWLTSMAGWMGLPPLDVRPPPETVAADRADDIRVRDDRTDDGVDSAPDHTPDSALDLASLTSARKNEP